MKEMLIDIFKYFNIFIKELNIIPKTA